VIRAHESSRKRRCATKQTLLGRFSASDRIIPSGSALGFADLQNKIAFGASKQTFCL